MTDDNYFNVKILDSEKSPLQKLTQYLPLAISILAITLSFWQAWAGWRHDELGVQPIMTFNRNVSVDGSHPCEACGTTITNSGQGPAIVHDPAYFLDGTEYVIKQASDLTPIREKFKAMLSNTGDFHWNILKDGEIIRAGETRQLYWVEGSKILHTKIAQEDFKQLVQSRMSFSASVCSLYKVCELFCISAADDCSKLKRASK